jgi:hypothetical protein
MTFRTMTSLVPDNLAETPWERVETMVEVSSQPGPELAQEDVIHEEVDEVIPAKPSGGGILTIPLMCLGIGLIAMCLLIPAADENRHLAYERDRLQLDLDQLHKQAATNDAFLKNIANDPSLSERLARRQMKMVPQGTSVIQLKSQKHSADMSPFTLVTVPPPPPMPEYRPVGGVLAGACRHPKTQLYMIGAGMLMIACGVVLGKDGSALAEESEGSAAPRRSA